MGEGRWERDEEVELKWEGCSQGCSQRRCPGTRSWTTARAQLRLSWPGAWLDSTHCLGAPC